MRTSLFLVALSILLLGDRLADATATFPMLLLRVFVLLAFSWGFVLAVAGDVQDLRGGRS